jgi:hypothetical protein
MNEFPNIENIDAYIAECIEEYYFDPLGFVRWCFPWGEPGGPLAEPPWDKMADWQEDYLRDLGEECYEAAVTGRAVQMATCSGHGVGKSALVAWIIIWFMSTRTNPQIVVTANTKEQLTSKTWREVAKWQKMAMNGFAYTWHATSFALKGHEDTWIARAVPWSAHNSEAFAGTHEKNVLLLFDEASAIDDVIWEVASGAMSTPGAMMCAFGNPTKNSGRFRECWRRFSDRWRTYEVDSREVPFSNKQKIAQDIEDHGIDSDYVRIRWLGKFPERSATQLISNGVVEAAQRRKIEDWEIPSATPKIMGVDIARQGNDKTVCRVRRGPKLLEDKLVLRIADTMQVASRVAAFINKHQPDTVYIDAIGIGAGVYDRLCQLGYTNVVAVQVGEKAGKDNIYFNKRMEIWANMGAWLETADIPEKDTELMEDMTAPEFLYDARERWMLESKDDLRERIGRSPDEGDAVALMFTHPNPIKREDEQAAAEPEEV